MRGCAKNIYERVVSSKGNKYNFNIKYYHFLRIKKARKAKANILMFLMKN